jgi:8-oxo-dGTP pyrophosphatase MutT (NUDIX family)
MTMDARWVQRLHARGAQPPRRARVPLRLEPAAAEIGSIEPELAGQLEAAGLPVRRHGGACVLAGDADRTLAQVARWLRDAGLASRWRDEMLAVTDAHGHVHAAIERAAVRPLGIATYAVHLVGFTDAGEVWVQQRALDKATDPGLWDTLVGGLCTAGESHALTLERETWEEAGLRLAELRGLRKIGTLTVRRPVDNGYMVEHIENFEAQVPLQRVPLNQDGEVAGFARRSQVELRAQLVADAFTLEAALVLVQWLAQPRA